MAIQIITPRHTEVEEYKELFFQRKGDYAGNGFGFNADADGNVVFTHELEKVREAQRENYERLLTDDRYEAPRITTHRRTYTVPALAKCHCGAEIYLQDSYMGACDCPKCGRWYSLSGQELKDPKYWRDGDDWDDEE